jgi:hypothetical protein
MGKCQDDTADTIANEHGVSRRTVFRAADYAKAVDEIANNCGGQVKQNILNSNLKLPQSYIIYIAENLSDEEQKELFKHDAKHIKNRISQLKNEKIDYLEKAKAIVKKLNKEERKELIKFVKSI